MKIRISLALTVLAAALPTWTAPAQTNSTQELIPITFTATSTFLAPNRGRLVRSRITDRDIIAQATGIRPANPASLRNFALVYNPSQDSIQVVGPNGQPVVDVIHFGAGAAISDGRQTSRFTLLFFPGQTNEFGAETNVFGSAVINQRAINTAGRNLLISGNVQFMLSGGLALGTTNAFPAGTGGTGTGAGSGTTVSGNGPAGNGSGSGVLTADPFVLVDPGAQIFVGVFTSRPGRVTGPGFAPVTNGGGTNNGLAPGTGGTTGGATNGAVPGGTTNGVVPGTNTIPGTTGTTMITPGTGTSLGTGVVTGIGSTVGSGTAAIGGLTTPAFFGSSTPAFFGGSTPTGLGTVPSTTTTAITGTGF